MVEIDLTVTQLQDAVGDSVQEFAVVGHDQERTLVLGEVFRQPVAGGLVEVVGRLVEEYVVGPPHQHFRQRDAHLPAAAEGPARLLPVRHREAQPVQHARDAGLDAIAVQAVELLEQLRLLFDQRVDVAVPRDESVCDLRQAQLGAAGLREGRPHLGEERVVALDAGLLLQVAQLARPAFVRLAADARAALVRLILAGDDAQERRLARAVRPHQAGALALAHGERDALEHVQAAKRARYGFSKKHRYSVYRGHKSIAPTGSARMRSGVVTPRRWSPPVRRRGAASPGTSRRCSARRRWRR